MTGHGGWPLNVFLTPEQMPFYGGTYFPPEPRHGMPSWRRCCRRSPRRGARTPRRSAPASERMREQLGARSAAAARRPSPSTTAALDTRGGGAAGVLRRAPTAASAARRSSRRRPCWSSCCARGEREMSLATLRAMAAGGIHDQVGGGFHRYAVDATWTVPHFEKMLYDNALLARAYLHGCQASATSQLTSSVLPRDARLGAARDARAGGRLLLRARRRLRGRRGPLLRVDASGSCATRSARTPTPRSRWLGVSERGNFEDPHHPEPGLNVLTDRGPGRRPAASASASARGCWRRARRARGPASTTSA